MSPHRTGEVYPYKYSIVHHFSIPMLNLVPEKIPSMLSNEQTDYHFPKNEKLKSKKIIDHLFKSGQSKVFFPVRVVWDYGELTEKVPAQCTVSVSKKNFSNASDRNRLKRQVRETYRLNKKLLFPVLEEKETQLAIMILYVGKDFTNFSEINRQTRRALTFISKKIQADASIPQQNPHITH